MNTTIKSIAGLGIAVILLSGCEETRQALGQTKQSPDEFAVFSRAPLSLPPDYALRPPKPGAERPQLVNPRDRARQAIVANSSNRRNAARPEPGPEGASPGEVAVLRAAGAMNPQSNIRQLINRETSALASESVTFTDKLIFWRDPEAFGTKVDPNKERRRILEQQAVGEPLNKGEVPTISQKQKAIFEGVFK
ncbi:MAG: DUF3035 domain-containing protein [Proteobacteria bacterium]|nr:DUF3035 domain-containing protein [Pseudomonadota bacterium]